MKKETVQYLIITLVLIVVVGTISFFIYKHFTKEEVPTEDIIYDVKDMPRVDASTVTQPYMSALVSEFTGKKVEELEFNYTKTHQAYVKLIDNETDIIIVTEPSEDELAYASKQGVELEVIPVLNEAFVFFVNKDNAVDELSLTDIQNIYSGKTTNWNEIGGEDFIISAYQRPVNSGSQTGMLSLVMKDIKMKQPLKEEYIESMAGIIETVANYDNAKNAIGYSYYYYAKTMYGNDNIKFVGIDGVKPTFDTIHDQTYPIMSGYYMVIRKDEASDSMTRKIANEILSHRGKKVATSEGYIPVK